MTSRPVFVYDSKVTCILYSLQYYYRKQVSRLFESRGHVSPSFYESDETVSDVTSLIANCFSSSFHICASIRTGF